MSPGQGYIAFMEEAEGLKLSPYLDEAGIPTIGIGSTRYIDGNHVQMTDPPITEQQAVSLLMYDTLNNQRLLNSFFPDGTITQNQNDAFLSFIYREGAGAFQTSTILRLARVNPQDPDIQAAWNRWDEITVDGKRQFSQGELNRCQKEYALYIS